MKKLLIMLLVLALSSATFTLGGCTAQSADSSAGNTSGDAGQTAVEDSIDPFEEFTVDGITLRATGYYSMSSDQEVTDGVSILGRFGIRFAVVSSDVKLEGMSGYTSLSSRMNDAGFTLVDTAGNVFECTVLAAGKDLEFVDIGTLSLADAGNDYVKDLTFQAPGMTIPVKLLSEIDHGF